MVENKQISRRRIFIRSKDRISQIFSFTQESDGSIYCAFPDFATARWLNVQVVENFPQIITTQSIGEGKISFHATGMTAIRPNDNPEAHEHIIKGNYLIDKDKELIGTRHLFTIYMKDPTHYPDSSPLFNRQSDYCIEANEDVKPFVLIFFAVPQQGINVNFQINFRIDNMVNAPSDVLGLHNFSLRYHDVFWFAYRTKYMDKWPKESHVCYDDGFVFPTFIGTGDDRFELEYRAPVYTLSDSQLSIVCNQNYPDNRV